MTLANSILLAVNHGYDVRFFRICVGQPLFIRISDYNKEIHKEWNVALEDADPELMADSIERCVYEIKKYKWPGVTGHPREK